MNYFELIFLVMAPIALFIIMAGMGTTLKLTAFADLARYPKAALLGLCCQILALPALGLLTAMTLKLPDTIAVGLILLAACPGGAPSNAIAFVARADTVLSVSLTAVNSLVVVVTMPLVLLIGSKLLSVSGIAQLDVPAVEIVKQLLILTALPISIGMTIGHFFPIFSRRSERFVRAFAIIALLILVSAVAANQADYFIANITEVGGLIFSFMLAISLFSYGMCRLFNLARAQAITVIIETAMQNTFLAIYVATNILKDTQILLLPSTYGVMSMPIVAFIIWICLKIYPSLTKKRLNN